jgi:DnaK suppressor protein
MADHKLKKSQIAELRGALLDKRRELLAQLSEGTQALGGNDGNESEVMDQAEDAIESDARGQRAARDSRLLIEIENALRKIDAGTYGISEENGEPIAYERLRAIPWARLTVQEEEQLERLGRP